MSDSLLTILHATAESDVARSLHTDLINLTMIGTMIFVSMDLPDICLAVSYLFKNS